MLDTTCSVYKWYRGDNITIYLNIQTKCSNCTNTHYSKAEITEDELVDLFKMWIADLKGDVEIYPCEQNFMVTTSNKVIQEYKTLVGGDIQIASRID